MMEYEIYETETFSRIFDTLTGKERNWIRKMKLQLKVNPKAGKPLGFEWFREKKFENKRLYFVISLKKPRILLVSFASKKEQQKIIAYVTLHKEEYVEFINSF